jgi:hypothetical protein
MIGATVIALEMLDDGRIPTFGPRISGPDDPTPIFDDVALEYALFGTVRVAS